jgi:signal transduction histidine kinase
MRRPRTDGLEDTKLGALAAAVGHELGNIAVPLGGFTELAFQNIAADDPARQNLDEIRIAIDRIKSLTWELQSLGEFEAIRTRLLVGECMPTEADGAHPKSWRIDWLCSEHTAVILDRLHAERAIHALARIAAPGVPQMAPDVLLRVSQGVPRAARCGACGAALARNSEVLIQVTPSRPVGSDALRDPLGCGAAGRGLRLALAVLVHCAHRAGGHVLLESASGSLALAFPAAD